MCSLYQFPMLCGYNASKRLQTLRENFVSRMAKTRASSMEATTKVFATAGLTGATTREIACIAAVNDVTLFRHFQNM